MSYCSQSDVEGWLQPHTSDLVATEAFGSSQAVQARIRALLPATKKAVDWLADRDFEYHADATVTLDGDGASDTLFLCDRGIKPIESVASVTENGETVDADSYVVYDTEGLIRKCGAGGYAPGGVWSEGVRNIVVRLTYGYSDVRQQLPEIVQAQALLTAAAVLAQAAGAGSGGVESTRLGSFAVTFGADNAYASMVTSWVQQAQEIVGRFRRAGLNSTP
ncbi:MAG: hypothetical protein ACE5JM_11590 [Armatimonadota bacterium]